MTVDSFWSSCFSGLLEASGAIVKGLAMTGSSLSDPLGRLKAGGTIVIGLAMIGSPSSDPSGRLEASG